MRLDRTRGTPPPGSEGGAACRLPGPSPWALGAVVLALIVAPAAGLAQTLPLQFLNLALPDAVKGQPYDDGGIPAGQVFIAACGGFSPYTFSLLDGDVPAGMQMESNGHLSGTPTDCGSSVFQVRVVDSIDTTLDGTFVLDVGGPGDLVAPAQVNVSVEAGQTAGVTVNLTNDGCDDVAFATQTADFGSSPPVPLAAWALAGVAGEMAVGGPVPRTVGSVQGPRPTRGEGWSMSADGRLLDGEGNLAGVARVGRDGLQAAPAPGQTSVLYINESATTGEIDRFTGLGFFVVEAVVPQALDAGLLDAFDVVYLVAATDSAFPSRDAIMRYVWEGGGLVIEQVEVSGMVPLLPAGYALDATVSPPGGSNSDIVFTLEGGFDPLTSGLFQSDLATSFDTTFLKTSGERWTWLAGQNDQRDGNGNIQLGALARATLGEGRIIYHTGNLGTSVSPGVLNGSDAYLFQLIDQAASGGAQTSCPWLGEAAGASNVRAGLTNVTAVESFDITGETVTLTLPADATGLAVGTHSCRLTLLTDETGTLETSIDVTLTVTDPAAPTITIDELEPANPGTPYGDTVTAAGGTPPYTFTLLSGALPAGLVLDALTGAVSGTPTEAGMFLPTFRLTDSLGAFSDKLVPISSGFHITTGSLPDAIIGQVYAEPIFVTGGVPPYSFEIEAAIDLALPVADPNQPEAQLCATTDLGGGGQSTDCALVAGAYRVTFGSVAGFVSPPDAEILVGEGGAVSVVGDYLQQGSVTVTASIPDASYLLFGETPAGEVSLTAGGDSTTFTDLTPGTYTLFFDAVTAFTTPPDQAGTLTEGGALTFNGDYQLVPGAIRVKTNLGFEATFVVTATTAQGPITLDGSGPRTIFLDQPAGDYTVTFDPVAGFDTPPPQTGTLVFSDSLTLSGTYVATAALAATPDGPLAAAPVGPVRGATAASPAVPGLFEDGTGTGTVTVVSDAPGATFRILGQGIPSELSLVEPGGLAGNGASLAGVMLSLTDPLLFGGRRVPLAVIAHDSDSPPNSFRRAYAINVFDAPFLSSIRPATAAHSQVFDLEIFGFGLRTSATLSVGNGVTLDPPAVGPGSGGTSSLVTEARIDPDALLSARDVVYTDTRLSGTAFGSQVRLPGALRLFANATLIDLDGSGRIDGFELARVARDFGLSSTDPLFDPVLDFTRDGTIDGDDLGSLSVVFGRRSLDYDPADLPLPAGTIGVPYDIGGDPVTIRYLGGNGAIAMRQIAGTLPDGLVLTLVAGSAPPDTTELTLTGVPAETGTFQFTVQSTDSFFAIATRQFTVVIDPPTP
ncbi:MAG: putative Ig domain-containing protein [Acidobacteriota bacterium]